MKPRPVLAASAWIYQGVWRILVDWFRVPQEPPSLPSFAGEAVASFRPSEGFLRCMQFWFWILVLIIDGALLFTWVVILAGAPIVGVLLAPLFAAIIILPDIVAYIAIHLRYDTTWYVLSERSLRIRRGIWVIRETTITYENVQNLKIEQGPLQRFFRIANLMVETAGGGGAPTPEGQLTAGHHGLIEGVAEAQEIRDLVLAQLRRTRTAGLGDEHHLSPRTTTAGLAAEHVEVLREIRDLTRALAAAS